MLTHPDPEKMPVSAAADGIVRSLRPALATAVRELESGMPVPAVLSGLALAGFLAGRGMDPAGAAALVHRWRSTGVWKGVAHPADPERARRPELIRLIRAAMQDEASAAVFYTELANLTKDARVRDYIIHARDDEVKHYRMLGELHQQLTGEPFEARPMAIEYTGLRDGLEKAMDDEYEAFEEYRDVYLKYDDERIRRVYFELMTDELEHATRFNYALQVIGE